MQPVLIARRRLPQLADALVRLMSEDRAQDLAEYGISMAVLGVGAVVAALSIGGEVNELWIHAARLIQKVTLAASGS